MLIQITIFVTSLIGASCGDENRNLALCRAGQYLKPDNTCGECSVGKGFSNTPNRNGACTPCTTICEQYVPLHPCNATHDLLCGCRTGYVEANGDCVDPSNGNGKKIDVVLKYQELLNTSMGFFLAKNDADNNKGENLLLDGPSQQIIGVTGIALSALVLLAIVVIFSLCYYRNKKSSSTTLKVFEQRLNNADETIHILRGYHTRDQEQQPQSAQQLQQSLLDRLNTAQRTIEKLRAEARSAGQDRMRQTTLSRGLSDAEVTIQKLKEDYTSAELQKNLSTHFISKANELIAQVEANTTAMVDQIQPLSTHFISKANELIAEVEANTTVMVDQIQPRLTNLSYNASALIAQVEANTTVMVYQIQPLLHRLAKSTEIVERLIEAENNETETSPMCGKITTGKGRIKGRTNANDIHEDRKDFNDFANEPEEEFHMDNDKARKKKARKNR